MSRQSALAFYGLIPEHVPLTTSVGGGRPQRWDTPLGNFDVRHLRRELLDLGVAWTDLGDGQQAAVATPEKALLDLVYLEPGAQTRESLSELRLQGFERLDLDALHELAEHMGKPKLRRAAQRIAELAAQDEEWESL